jgi:hypothetical protein
MPIDATARSTRRALLTAAGAAFAGFAAATLGRAQSAVAANGDVVRVGQAHAGTEPTVIRGTDSSTTLVASNTGGGLALFANAGLTGHGVIAQGETGIEAFGHDGYGIRGYGSTVGVVGVGTLGVRGRGERQRAGVYGSTGDDPPADPISSRAPASTAGALPRGSAGASESPVEAPPPGDSVCSAGATPERECSGRRSGYALSALGRCNFRTSGIGTIAAGTSSETIDPGVPMGASTRVLVTLHGDPGGSVVLKRVAKSGATDTFTVHLTGNAGANVNFSWFLIG